jgi:hypothetical protein
VKLAITPAHYRQIEQIAQELEVTASQVIEALLHQAINASAGEGLAPAHRERLDPIVDDLLEAATDLYQTDAYLRERTDEHVAIARELTNDAGAKQCQGSSSSAGRNNNGSSSSSTAA